MITVGIVDDHKMFIDGLVSIFEDETDITVAWTCSDRAETLAIIENTIPDVILMDITLGAESGIDLTKEILELHPNIKVLALSMHFEDNYIVKMLEHGAKGYLLKDAGAEEMIQAIRIVNEGKLYYSDHVSKILIKHITQGTNPVDQEPSPLTPRETEILQLISQEMSNPEIAEQLFISVRTVDTHRRNLLDKLNVKNTVGLVKYAIKHGLAD